jgi:branched-chain amino acid transport system substrate-binding protein
MKKGIKIIIVVAAIALGAFLVLGNNQNDSAHIKIGLMAPLSGEYAIAGENYQKGIELALEEYRAQHPDAQIELVVEDDGFDVKKGVSAYRKLTGLDKVDAMLTISTPVIDAIHEDIQQSDLIVMQLGIQTVGIADDNIFQTSSAPEEPVKLFAQFIEDNYDFKKVAVVYDNTAGGNTFLAAFDEGYNKDFTKFVVNDREDLRDHALRINGENYEAVVFLTSPENGALLSKEILALDDTPPLFAYDAQLQTGFGDYERILGDTNVLNGSISMWLKAGESEKFATAFKKKYGEDPGFVADFGYDTFNILMDNYDSDREKWMDNIQSYESAGPSGNISFDINGIRIQDIVINTIVRGEIAPLE